MVKRVIVRARATAVARVNTRDKDEYVWLARPLCDDTCIMIGTVHAHIIDDEERQKTIYQRLVIDIFPSNER